MSIPQLKMRPEVARMWVDALRSGDYKQGKHRLTTVTDDGVEHCCLGVLCEIAVQEGVIPPGKPDDVSFLVPKAILYGKHDAGAVPPTEVNQWAFEGFDEDAADDSQVVLWTAVDTTGEIVQNWPARSGAPGSVSLTEVNDAGVADFERIAQLVEDTHCVEVAA